MERLIPVSALPFSFDGTARHNLSNGLQAMAAALELGIAWGDVRKAMSAFAMGIDSTPGRLNFHEDGGFTALMDFVEHIRVVIDEKFAVDAALKQVAPSDLLVFLCGAHLEPPWRQILDFMERRSS